jgi:nucleotide-binding universal stress UspA family protein
VFERIVVPLDGSILSTQAIPYATEVGKRFESEIILVRVIPPPFLVMTQQVTAGESPDSEDVNNATYAKRYLMDLDRSLKAQGVKVSFEVTVGTPAKAIMQLSEAQKASLIVMMSHGYGSFKRAIMGSVADEILRHSSIPVLIIKARNLVNK